MHVYIGACIFSVYILVLSYGYDSVMDYHYQRFNARKYLEERCPGNEFKETDSRIHTQWGLKCLHRFYKDFHKNWDKSTASLLEFGAGPYLHTLISAAPYVNIIYHTDFLEECRREVLLWKNKDPKAYNWSPYFQFVVNTLEGQSGMDEVIERQELLRSKLKDSLFLDMKSDDPLPAHPGQFDLIYTGFCIESIASCLEEYKVIMKKVFGLLNPNGYLIMLANQGCTWYSVNNVKYPTYPIRIDEILSTLEEIGFTLHYMESMKKEYEEGKEYYNDKKYYSFYIAQKLI